eukprot:2226128-Rhodomonas_salina.1
MDTDKWVEKQCTKGRKMGVAGAAMVSQSKAFAAASSMIAAGRPMSEVTASFRCLRATDRYEVTLIAMAVESFINKYAPRDRDIFRTMITENSVAALLRGAVIRNPAQTGLR